MIAKLRLFKSGFFLDVIGVSTQTINKNYNFLFGHIFDVKIIFFFSKFMGLNSLLVSFLSFKFSILDLSTSKPTQFIFFDKFNINGNPT